MADIVFTLIVGLVVWTGYALMRVVDLFAHWRPAVATVWRSDYTQVQQSEDFWSFGFTAFTSRGWNWRDGEDSRLIEDEVRFLTAEGERRVALVERRVARGWRPDGVYPIWYDPADPARVTAFGPLRWLLMTALGAVATAMAASVLAQTGMPPMLARVLAGG